MNIKNTSTAYGAISILFHWLSAAIIILLFVLGYIMDGFSYYDPRYQTWPHLHKSLGVILFALILLRLLWLKMNTKVLPMSSHKTIEKITASAAKHLMYLCLFVLFISGFLISTASGDTLEVFNWFSISPVFDLAYYSIEIGTIHKYAAYGLILLSLLHALGAIKHHFIDKDNTLKRMLNLKVNSL